MPLLLAVAWPAQARSCDNLGTLSFMPGSAKFSNASPIRGLDTIVRNPHAYCRLMVVGEADTPARTKKNSLLAQRRAEALRTYLVSLGVPPSRIMIGIRSDPNGGGIAWVDTAAGCGRETSDDVFDSSHGGCE